jgi:MoxR-like ATPase
MGGELESARSDLQAAQRDREELLHEIEAVEEKAEEDLARARAEWVREEKRMSSEAARLRDKARDAEAEAERWKKMLAKVEIQTHTLEDGGALGRAGRSHSDHMTGCTTG